jgi:hypothetical protein
MHYTRLFATWGIPSVLYRGGVWIEEEVLGFFLLLLGDGHGHGHELSSIHPAGRYVHTCREDTPCGVTPPSCFGEACASKLIKKRRFFETIIQYN